MKTPEKQQEEWEKSTSTMKSVKLFSKRIQTGKGRLLKSVLCFSLNVV
jgi:hypothetical protein